MVSIECEVRAIRYQPDGIRGLYYMLSIGQVDYSNGYSNSRQAMVRSLVGVFRSKSIALRRLRVDPRVIYGYSQLYLLGVYRSQRMDFSVLFRRFRGGFRGLFGGYVWLGGLVSYVGSRVRYGLIISTSSYVRLLSYVPSPISRIYLGGTIGVFVFVYGLGYSIFRVLASPIRSVGSLFLLVLHRGPLLYGRYRVYGASTSVLLVRSLIRESKYIGVVGRLVYLFYGAATPWLYRLPFPFSVVSCLPVDLSRWDIGYLLRAYGVCLVSAGSMSFFLFSTVLVASSIVSRAFFYLAYFVKRLASAVVLAMGAVSPKRFSKSLVSILLLRVEGRVLCAVFFAGALSSLVRLLHVLRQACAGYYYGVIGFSNCYGFYKFLRAGFVTSRTSQATLSRFFRPFYRLVGPITVVFADWG